MRGRLVWSPFGPSICCKGLGEVRDAVMIVSQANDRHVQQDANIQHELPEREVTKSRGNQFVDLGAVKSLPTAQPPNRPTAQPVAISGTLDR